MRSRRPAVSATLNPSGGARPRGRYLARVQRSHSVVPRDSLLGTPRSRELAVPSAAQIERCRRCDLWRRALHGVPGAGPAGCPLMLVGEQPGDQEDRTGQPFVGPAGRELDRLLREAGVERSKCYVTNAVKHFKWEPRGKRRLHRRPNPAEIEACNPWLEQEIAALKPKVIIALGSTAARALLKHSGTVAALRRLALVHPLGARLFVTYHPSAVLRADAGAKALRSLLLRDLRRAHRLVRAGNS